MGDKTTRMNNLTFIEAQTEVVGRGGLITHVDCYNEISKWFFKTDKPKARLLSKGGFMDWWPGITEQKRPVWGVERKENFSGAGKMVKFNMLPAWLNEKPTDACLVSMKFEDASPRYAVRPDCRQAKRDSRLFRIQGFDSHVFNLAVWPRKYGIHAEDKSGWSDFADTATAEMFPVGR